MERTFYNVQPYTVGGYAWPGNTIESTHPTCLDGSPPTGGRIGYHRKRFQLAGGKTVWRCWIETAYTQETYVNGTLLDLYRGYHSAFSSTVRPLDITSLLVEGYNCIAIRSERTSGTPSIAYIYGYVIYTDGASDFIGFTANSPSHNGWMRAVWDNGGTPTPVNPIPENWTSPDFDDQNPGDGMVWLTTKQTAGYVTQLRGHAPFRPPVWSWTHSPSSHTGRYLEICNPTGKRNFYVSGSCIVRVKAPINRNFHHLSYILHEINGYESETLIFSKTGGNGIAYATFSTSGNDRYVDLDLDSINGSDLARGLYGLTATLWNDEGETSEISQVQYVPIMIIGDMGQPEIDGISIDEGWSQGEPEITLDLSSILTGEEAPYPWVEKFNENGTLTYRKSANGDLPVRITLVGNENYRELGEQARSSGASHASFVSFKIGSESESGGCWEHPGSWYLCEVDYINYGRTNFDISISPDGEGLFPIITVQGSEFWGSQGSEKQTAHGIFLADYPIGNEDTTVIIANTLVDNNDNSFWNVTRISQVRFYHIGDTLPKVRLGSSSRLFGMVSETPDRILRNYAAARDSAQIYGVKVVSTSTVQSSLPRAYCEILRALWFCCEKYLQYVRFRGMNLVCPGTFMYSWGNGSRIDEPEYPGSLLSMDEREVLAAIGELNGVSIISHLEWSEYLGDGTSNWVDGKEVLYQRFLKNLASKYSQYTNWKGILHSVDPTDLSTQATGDHRLGPMWMGKFDGTDPYTGVDPIDSSVYAYDDVSMTAFAAAYPAHSDVLLESPGDRRDWLEDPGNSAWDDYVTWRCEAIYEILGNALDTLQATVPSAQIFFSMILTQQVQNVLNPLTQGGLRDTLYGGGLNTSMFVDENIVPGPQLRTLVSCEGDYGVDVESPAFFSEILKDEFLQAARRCVFVRTGFGEPDNLSWGQGGWPWTSYARNIFPIFGGDMGACFYAYATMYDPMAIFTAFEDANMMIGHEQVTRGMRYFCALPAEDMDLVSSCLGIECRTVTSGGNFWISLINSSPATKTIRVYLAGSSGNCYDAATGDAIATIEAESYRFFVAVLSPWSIYSVYDEEATSVHQITSVSQSLPDWWWDRTLEDYELSIRPEAVATLATADRDSLRKAYRRARRQIRQNAPADAWLNHFGVQDHREDAEIQMAMGNPWYLLGMFFYDGTQAGFDNAGSAAQSDILNGVLNGIYAGYDRNGIAGNCVWKTASLIGRDGEPGYVELEREFIGKDNAIAFASTYFHAPDAGGMTLRLGVPGAAKVWVDGNLEYSRFESDGVRSINLPISCGKGIHQLVIKAGQKGGDWGIYCSFKESGNNYITIPRFKEVLGFGNNLENSWRTEQGTSFYLDYLFYKGSPVFKTQYRANHFTGWLGRATTYFDNLGSWVTIGPREYEFNKLLVSSNYRLYYRLKFDDANNQMEVEHKGINVAGGNKTASSSLFGRYLFSGYGGILGAGSYLKLYKRNGSLISTVTSGSGIYDLKKSTFIDSDGRAQAEIQTDLYRIRVIARDETTTYWNPAWSGSAILISYNFSAQTWSIDFQPNPGSGSTIYVYPNTPYGEEFKALFKFYDL